MSDRIRTRFAPSPTGYMHIGNLRTALYAYLFAKANKGDFLLRIEDTDQKRFVADAVDFINRTLAAAHIVPNEGPDIGGDCGRNFYHFSFHRLFLLVFNGDTC